LEKIEEEGIIERIWDWSASSREGKNPKGHIGVESHPYLRIPSF
jgi:hypothetical protein